MSPELKVNRILFATDFLESSRLALDYAVAFAEHFKATIVMLHVVELTQAAREVEVLKPGQSATRRFAAERLETLAAGVRRLGLPVETHTDDGLPCEVILSAVDRYNADLLGFGCPRRTPWAGPPPPRLKHRENPSLLQLSNSDRWLSGAGRG